MSVDEDSQATPAESSGKTVIEAAQEVLRGALHVAEASLALLRAELKLARSSALAIIWLGFALVFLGATAWLALTASIAAGIYLLTGNILVGIGLVALGNLIGVFFVIRAMRRCWHDMSLPRTRALIGSRSAGRGEPHPASTSLDASS